ncbi:MAG TPA: class I SAM-dependent methyltransferase [Polyangiaceae bacterium]
MNESSLRALSEPFEGYRFAALDLGSGPCPAPGYVGVDLCAEDPKRAVIEFDLFSGARWPFADESVERLRCCHVIEHIPHERVGPRRQDSFFWFFDEAYRISKPGCRFELRWPHPWHDFADQDPTHCRRIPAATLDYLSRAGRRALRVEQYPVSCNWVVEPGSVEELASAEALEPFRHADGSFDLLAAKRSVGVFHEITAVLIKT